MSNNLKNESDVVQMSTQMYDQIYLEKHYILDSV